MTEGKLASDSAHSLGNEVSESVKVVQILDSEFAGHPEKPGKFPEGRSIAGDDTTTNTELSSFGECENWRNRFERDIGAICRQGVRV